MGSVNSLGLGTIRILRHVGAVMKKLFCCFFELDGSGNLQPQLVITDFCDTFDLNADGDIEPEVSPGPSGCFDIDSNGDLMPYA